METDSKAGVTLKFEASNKNEVQLQKTMRGKMVIQRRWVHTQCMGQDHHGIMLKDRVEMFRCECGFGVDCQSISANPV